MIAERAVESVINTLTDEQLWVLLANQVYNLDARQQTGRYGDAGFAQAAIDKIKRELETRGHGEKLQAVFAGGHD